jgi:hypothetical protein
MDLWNEKTPEALLSNCTKKQKLNQNMNESFFKRKEESFSF